MARPVRGGEEISRVELRVAEGDGISGARARALRQQERALWHGSSIICPPDLAELERRSGPQIQRHDCRI